MRAISPAELRTTAGSVRHAAADMNVVVCSRPCFEALRRTAPLTRYTRRQERSGSVHATFERLRELAGTVGDGVRIAPSRIAGAGNGVFATRDYARGAPITEYVGIARHLDAGHELALPLRSHMIDMGERYTLDGRYTPEGALITDPARQLAGRGAGAFLNDPRGTPFAANTEFEELESPEASLLDVKGRESEIKPHMYMMLLRALRDVYAGDELLVDYGESYWDEHGAL
jgi:hypothetical protein